MLGEWALKIVFDEPVRDVVIEKLTFGDEAMAMDHSKMGHGDAEEKTGHDREKLKHRRGCASDLRDRSEAARPFANP